MSDIRDVNSIHSEPRYFVKKPIAIQAMQYSWGSWTILEEFTGGLVRENEEKVEVYDRLHDTWVQFYRDDWILKGIQGEFYPCNGEVFSETYEETDPVDF